MTDIPTPRRHRPRWQADFLETIRSSGNVALAARAAGVSRTAPYARASRDPVFAKAWAEAEQVAVDALEAEAWRRALISSDGLLMFLLKAMRPERYRERVEVRFDIRREAQRLAAELGIDADALIAEAERIAAAGRP